MRGGSKMKIFTNNKMPTNNPEANTFSIKSVMRSVWPKCAVLAFMTVLAACGPNTAGPKSSFASNTASSLSPSLQSALCQGRTDEVISALTGEPLMSSSDQFYLALAYEEAGALPKARALYGTVMQNSGSANVYANCPDRVLAAGPVGEEAGRRLASLSQHLAALDVNLAPPAPLHDGLPPSSPNQYKEPPRNQSGGLTSGFAKSALSYTGAADQSVNKPTSQSPLGQWFAHLTSYRTMENAMKNRSTLEKKFPDLAGIIDQWELDVGGRKAIRLGVRLANKGEANRLCNSVKSRGEYCAVIDTSS